MINEKKFLNGAPAPKQPTKEDLQIKKLQLQIEQLEQKEQQQVQKEQPKASKLQTISGIAKGLVAICAVLLAPFIILGGFLLACAKATK